MSVRSRTVAPSSTRDPFARYEPIETAEQFDALVARPGPLPVALRRRLVRAASDTFGRRSVTGNLEQLLERTDLDLADLVAIVHQVTHEPEAVAQALAHPGADDTLVVVAAAFAWNTANSSLFEVVENSGQFGRALRMLVADRGFLDATTERAARVLADAGADAVTTAVALAEKMRFPDYVHAALAVALEPETGSR